jgi:hypothetical protein
MKSLPGQVTPQQAYYAPSSTESTEESERHEGTSFHDSH